MKKYRIYQKYIKRILDIIFSLIAVGILSPVFLIVALLIKRNLGSPVIFKQQRPGKDEKIFSLYKFRTMKDAENILTGEKLTDEERLQLIKDKGRGAVTSDEERQTRLGCMLRESSLDELPELLNILKGEMSIVGPRPLAILYLSYYNDFERHRHDVRPGLTGLAQVNGRNAISWEKKFAYDIEYVNDVSFPKDVSIIIKTIKVVFEHSDINQSEEDQAEGFHVVRQREWDEQREESIEQHAN